MQVVIVESPAKAKTINKYLGKDFTVLASYGHIRDLPAKDGSVRPDDGFSMDWEVDGKAAKHIKEITSALKGAERLYLATDPDREGEAISWHVREVLEGKNVLKGIDVKRITFNEITKSAIQEAIRNPRELDTELIEAYLARRALDYLVGFTLSPVLWRKLPGSRSAGRVQSVALRLICERESEIEVFKAREYWSVDADFKTREGKAFAARLTHLHGTKLEKFDLGNQTAAFAAAERIQASDFTIKSVERKKTKRNPAPPFTTSTLQQEAARKLHFAAKHTMQVAQRLYEGVTIGGETVGLITYMRTDGVQMAREAVDALRGEIKERFGAHFLPSEPRIYKSKAKNAQEAHEAIRPTSASRTPAEVKAYLDADQFRLYELIWKRTMASQMESAQFDQVAVDLASADGQTVLRANGSVLVFDGFLKLYREGMDDAEGDDENNRILPPMNEGDKPSLGAVTPEQHFTQPPPRYSEASLVNKMEELGIGRPSTYASVLSVLQDRDYVKLESRRFIPEDRGRVVTAFLENFFNKYVQYNFTADLENQLDDISGGRAQWQQVLSAFWTDFIKAVDETKDLTITQVLDTLDADLGPHFFPESDENPAPRKCPKCDDGRLGLKLGKFGAFIGCSNYPECKFTRRLAVNGNGGEGGGDTRVLGQDPETGKEVTLREGPYGHYVQLGEPEPLPEDESKPKKKSTAKKPPKPAMTKPKRTSLVRGMEPAAVDLQTALKLLALPREVGTHPETGKKITAGIGRFGPYLNHDGTFKSIPKDDDVLSIGMNRAVELLASARKKAPAVELGLHPKDKKPVTLQEGRYGPYVKHLKVMATIPKDRDKDSVTLEEALEWLKAKASKGGKKKAPAKKKAS